MLRHCSPSGGFTQTDAVVADVAKGVDEVVETAFKLVVDRMLDEVAATARQYADVLCPEKSVKQV